jgi:hypothetical protein
MTRPLTNPTLTDDQKLSLYRDGYVVVRGAVERDLVDAALARIDGVQKGESLAADSAMSDLVNRSSITPILTEAMGRFDPVTACQPGVNRVAEPSDRFGSMGYRDRDVPYFGAQLHMDGAITIAPPQEVMRGSHDEIYSQYFASGPRGDLGRSAEVMGHNMTPLFQDPAMTLGLGSFTSFLFVCLNDQMVEGCGQTSVLPGSHHAVERFFRWQRSVDNCIGPEGPGWPRLDHDAPNRCGLNYLPPTLREEFLDEASLCTPDGRRWPRPTPVLMEAGDVCIATYHLVHSASRNEFGSESRKNIIFRIRNKSRQPDKVLIGASDHPDRGWNGEWLDYPAGNDPWERSKDAMCDMWREWEGLREVVVQERGG